MKTGFNLSDWALNHRSFVWFLMVISLLAGAISYTSMGREEDPSFTIKTMVISAALPGATAEQTVVQVTDRIEKKLQELDNLKNTRSVTYPGQTVIYVDLMDTVRGDAVTDTWLKIRNMMSDLEPQMPEEFAGFYFNDDFGDVFGSVYAFTSDGFSPRELEERVDDIRSAVLQLDAAGKVELLGVREPVVHIEFSAARLAALGLDKTTVMNTLAAQNAIVPSGFIHTGAEQILVRVTGQFASAEELAYAPLRAGETFFTLADVADITPGYEDPPASLFRYNGDEAIALAVGMRAGENILDFGEELHALMARISAELPVGIEMSLVNDQPHVVDHSINHFVRALVEAVVIVLGVSFLSLGVRAGLVVSLSIPLVLAITFVFLDMMDITLQRISLGALIIALGLLVDDAMIAIETMISRLELGENLAKAASYAWTSIAFPMLTGTLVTVAGFIPIGLNASQAGEYTRSLFYVIAISLIASWVVAVLFAPVLGATFLPRKMKHEAHRTGRIRRGFHVVLRAAMRFKWVTIAATFLTFAVSVVGLGMVEQQFFPTSDRNEILVDVTLRQNADFDATDQEIAVFEDWLAEQEEAQYFATYVGQGAPRFVLTLDALTATPNIGQVMIMTADNASRDALKAKIQAFDRTRTVAEYFPKYLELGPPVGKPVQYRVSGPDFEELRDHARELAAVISSDPRLSAITLDWNEPARVVRVVLDQARLRQLGLTQQDVAQALYSLFEGAPVTDLRSGSKLISVLARGVEADRTTLEALENLQFGNANGTPIPLSAFARLEWGTEQPVIHQRDRVPTITVKAAILTADQPDTVVSDLAGAVEDFRASLPATYSVEVGGSVESSAESQAPILAVMPIMVLIMLTLVMVQMQSFRLMFVVLAVAPLGLIGVVAALLPAGAPLGFVAILGVLALIGILIRNSIILFQEVKDLLARGRSRWDAVFEASDSRARPILLTAAAASLALIPISRQVFWGPMAYAMMGGIIAGTLITLLFAPALYCAVFGVKRPHSGDGEPA
ncbi:Multidrug efflux pump subunit AcrB [Pseudooceanicola antarcticus]|uniref:AcrB/AcrD/AcrF family protein n=1 Tax=Pseudooceanicola antarcticus TaxID=1247613 RepID=A0A285IK52_9RHOB|nr:efflux RND transporter permease subunit [Pseudooceanicola antarcticus]PJE28761.1 AcrB/AcrD/AcrF family protein [Pseudooceanicola antarcticus]SNY48334.1 Multidrug efflux pump subunit AcrB [Pseudooceanicola antarcticus]